MKQNKYHVIGVMSGTSLDGIDLAEITFTISETEQWSYAINVSETIAYPVFWKESLKEVISYSEEGITIFNVKYTEYLAEVISKFIKKHQIKNIDAVCSHGHTVWHQPKDGFTLQIGNLPEIATFINKKVVCDFRAQDVLLGGNGAPLVPIGDQLLFNKYEYCLNLGGFANVSFESEEKRIAYDICPVNIVLNVLAEQLGFLYDEDGNLAKKGTVNTTLLHRLNDLSFYKERPPKSLGLEWVKNEIFPILDASEASVVDKLSTVTEHIAVQIANQFTENALVLATGGGTYNSYLLSRIRFYKKVRLVVPSSELIEFKEALIFGLLGVLKLREEVNCLSSVTGAENDHSSGLIYVP